MDFRALSELISEEFCGNEIDIESLAFIAGSSKSGRYVESVALRLIKSFRMMKNGQASCYDFEAALRTFLIVTSSKIYIPNYTLTTDNRFGLNVDRNGDIYVNYDIPNFLVDKFVRDSYLFNCNDIAEREDKPTPANGYISSLTNFRSFKSVAQQLAVIGALKVPEGYTALVAMKTGGGKSLITQSVAYQYENGLTIVVVPTISLMLDQTAGAKRLVKNGNVDREIMCYYSGCDENIVAKAIDHKEVRLLFLSPETLIKNSTLRQKIIESSTSGYLKNLIIDEAHIIIEWGASFREDFQCLDALRKVLLQYNPELRTYLLSATYDADTVNALRLFYSIGGRWIELRFDHLRKEQRYNIVKCGSYTEKHTKLKELVCLLPHPMIIYVNTPFDAECIRDELFEFGFKNTRIFTGKTNSDDRKKIIDEWINDEFDLMVATCAFGVGVDKKDVRTVIHTYIPSGPNQYYQECGRGGRDGLPCLCIMLYTSDDLQSAFRLSQKILTTEKLIGRWFSLINSNKTQKGINTTVIDTSIKPEYNEDDEFYSYANNADVLWNVDVILMLRKNGLISIENVEYTDERYLFYVRLNDYSILHDNEYTRTIFNDIRENEKALISRDFTYMKNALEQCDKRCVSDMFTRTYKLTEAYCSGCNAHKSVINEEDPANIIMHPVNAPITRPSDRISGLIQGKDELLVLAPNQIGKCIEYMVNMQVDVVVYTNLNDIDKASGCNDNKTLLVIDYSTFLNLCDKKNSFYLSGTIVLIMSNIEAHCKRMLASARKLPCKLVIITEDDFAVSGSEKKLSEIIDGPSISFSLLEKR